MNYVSYVTNFGNVFCILLEILIKRHEMTDTQYISLWKFQKCAQTKTPRLFNVAVCNNVHYTHKYTAEYVTFNSDNDFVPGEL